jgi:hypothetical protein
MRDVVTQTDQWRAGAILIVQPTVAETRGKFASMDGT